MAQTRLATASDFFQKAKTMVLNGEHYAAIDYYSLALQLKDDNSLTSEEIAKVHKFIANEYYHIGNYNFSFLHNTIALKVNPNQADAYYNRSLANNKRGFGFKQAVINDLEACVNIDSSYIEAWTALARIALERRDYSQAMNYASQAIKHSDVPDQGAYILRADINLKVLEKSNAPIYLANALCDLYQADQLGNPDAKTRMANLIRRSSDKDLDKAMQHVQDNDVTLVILQIRSEQRRENTASRKTVRFNLSDNRSVFYQPATATTADSDFNPVVSETFHSQL